MGSIGETKVLFGICAVYKVPSCLCYCISSDEAMMKEAIENMHEGISAGGATVSLI